MFHNIDQNTDDWLELRSGKVTGSAIAKIMANFGKAFGEPAKKYAVDVAVERLKGSRIAGDRYNNVHMEAGHAEEPIARMLYEDNYFCDVSNGGFFDNGNTGCSPDGLVGDTGMVEIKSVIPSVHYSAIKSGSYDSKYRWQLMFNLKETGREWIDYISYCEQFVEDKRLAVTRVLAAESAEYFDKIDQRLEEFENMVQDITNNIGS